MEPGRCPAPTAEVAAGFVADSTLRRARKRGPLSGLCDPGEYRAEEVRPIRRTITSGDVFPLPLADAPGEPYRGTD